MTAECRPPEGTPDGTWCVLEVQHTYDSYIDVGRLRWRWVAGGWQRYADILPFTPSSMHAHGWRFHSIATPPEDKP
jgi:hypothetical protein